MEQNKFIYCIDETLAKELKKYYELISVKKNDSKNIYIFENKLKNDNVFNFSKIDKSKYLFSNKLTF